jgi:hypothetical protein
VLLEQQVAMVVQERLHLFLELQPLMLEAAEVDQKAALPELGVQGVEVTEKMLL